MPKMSEGDMQEQASLDSIMKMRRKKKPMKQAPKKQMPMMDEGDMQEGASLRSAMSARKAMDKDQDGMKCGGKVKKMKSGGKVRGAGCVKKGVRACKMR